MPTRRFDVVILGGGNAGMGVTVATREAGLNVASVFANTQTTDLASMNASESVYWVRARPRRSWALCWRGVGRAIKVKGCSGAMAVTRVFRVSVARSASRVRKLWTGRPSSVRPVVCLLTAAGERSALATTLARSASAHRLVGVVVEQRRQALAHVPFEVVGQHAHKHVGTHAIGQPVIDRPDLEVDGLDAAEGVAPLG